MFWNRRPFNPLTSKSRELEKRVSTLRNELARLQSHLVQLNPSPSVPANTPTHTWNDEPILKPAPVRESAITPEGHYNELGVRKFDLASVWHKTLGLFRRAEENPADAKLASYLAHGGLPGLRPLRREKRVARNRFIILTLVLVVVLWTALSHLIPQL